MLGNKSAAALNPKIVNDEIIFVRGKIAIKPRAKFVNILCRGVAIKSPHRGIKATKAQHTKRYVSISATANWCKKNSSERFYLSRMMV